MSDGLVEDEFTNRPDDDELAFLQYEKLFRRSLDEALTKLQSESQDGYWDSHSHFMRTYINQVIATVQALSIELLEYWVNNPSQANDSKNFQQIKYDIDATITGIKVRHAQIVRKNTVRLDTDTRGKIRDMINKIKITLDSIELPVSRKEALMTKLNAFASEVDRDRTRLEAFGALAIEAANVAGKMERKLRPIRRWIDSIAGVMREARALEETQPRLPAPPKRISAPTQQAHSSSDLWAPDQPPKSGGGVGDDIPF